MSDLLLPEMLSVTMENFGKILIGAGLFVAILGVLLIAANKLGFPLGKLPGDIVYRRGNTTFYLPIVTSIVLSVLFSLVLWLFRR